MHTPTRFFLWVGLLVSVGVLGRMVLAQGQYGVPGESDANEMSITGDALERASLSALAHTEKGRVTETEVGDEESYYEVEITLESGDQIDVQLNEQFEVVGESVDREDTESSTE